LKVNDKLDIPNRDLPPGRLQLRKEHLVSELGIRDRAARKRRRRLVLVLVPAAIVLLGVTGFTTYALTREPTHLESVGCYDRASLDANVAVVGADGRDPAEICGEIWAQGALADAPVPDELASCVLDTGAIGVFPSSGAGTCEKLGLADLPASNAGRRQALRRPSRGDRRGARRAGLRIHSRRPRMRRRRRGARDRPS
jgi:hypothetical protein